MFWSYHFFSCFVFGHFWQRSYKNIMYFFVYILQGKVGKTEKNGKKIMQLKWQKYQKSKDKNECNLWSLISVDLLNVSQLKDVSYPIFMVFLPDILNIFKWLNSTGHNVLILLLKPSSKNPETFHKFWYWQQRRIK